LRDGFTERARKLFGFAGGICEIIPKTAKNNGNDAEYDVYALETEIIL